MPVVHVVLIIIAAISTGLLMTLIAFFHRALKTSPPRSSRW
jgi:hypothetical protein